MWFLLIKVLLVWKGVAMKAVIFSETGTWRKLKIAVV